MSPVSFLQKSMFISSREKKVTEFSDSFSIGMNSEEKSSKETFKPGNDVKFESN